MIYTPTRQGARLCAAVVVAVLLSPLSLCSAEENARFSAALNMIRSADLKEHVEVLADDSFEGREAGTRGGHAAAGYIARHLQQARLAGGGDQGTFYQSFDAGVMSFLKAFILV